MVPTSATILLANGLGAVVGPLIASAVMAGQGPHGLFLFTAVVHGVLAIYVLHRVRVQPSLAPPETTDFDIATTAPVGAVVTAEVLDPQSPDVAIPDNYVAPDASGGQKP